MKRNDDMPACRANLFLAKAGASGREEITVCIASHSFRIRFARAGDPEHYELFRQLGLMK